MICMWAWLSVEAAQASRWSRGSKTPFPLASKKVWHMAQIVRGHQGTTLGCAYSPSPGLPSTLGGSQKCHAGPFSARPLPWAHAHEPTRVHDCRPCMVVPSEDGLAHVGKEQPMGTDYTILLNIPKDTRIRKKSFVGSIDPMYTTRLARALWMGAHCTPQCQPGPWISGSWILSLAVLLL